MLALALEPASPVFYSVAFLHSSFKHIGKHALHITFLQIFLLAPIQILQRLIYSWLGIVQINLFSCLHNIAIKNDDYQVRQIGV